MSAIMFKLKCITNMHVGSGDVNYNLIDNEVERDPVTEYPMIHASGVKGALREYFSRNTEWAEYVDDIFGCDTQGKTSPGKLKFLEANMLAVPARASKGKCAYYLISTENAWNTYTEYLSLFWREEQKKQTEIRSKEQWAEERGIEGIDLSTSKILLDEEIHIVSEEEFRSISLPVIARNKLENGISKNVWYEEIVPHQSVFYFIVMSNDTPQERELLKKFKSAVDNQVIQFGANASIGYGLCKVTVAEE